MVHEATGNVSWWKLVSFGVSFKKIASHNNLWPNMKHEAEIKRKSNPNRGRDSSDGIAIW